MTFDLSILYALNGFTGVSGMFDAGIIFCAVYLPYLVGISFVLWFLLQLSEGDKKQAFFVFTVTALLGTGIILLLHSLYSRARPYVDHVVTKLVDQGGLSFPSIHSSIFFSLALIVYGFNKKLSILFFVGAFVITIARVTSGIHYPSDILGGFSVALISVTLGRYAYKKLLD